ncbi:MAG: 16S rRNA (guanine(966)-N(2))-methyltransferase RsmD [Rubrivivax sp.]
MSKPSSRAPGARPGEVRLIGGRFKRSRLPVPDAPGLRPTPDRVRETLFNWLGQDLAGWRVLDAFAGSGALGFEAASRGASAVTLLEHDARLVAGLSAVRQRLGADAVSVLRADALAWMARAPRGGFDLVLLDPPFGAGLAAPALAASAPLLGERGFVYLETEAAESAVPQPEGLEPVRELNAGAVRARLFRRAG